MRIGKKGTMPFIVPQEQYDVTFSLRYYGFCQVRCNSFSTLLRRKNTPSKELTLFSFFWAITFSKKFPYTVK